MARFEILDHTADVGIVAHGDGLEEAFANAAYGMFSLMADLDRVGEGLHREIDVEALDQEALLVAWLNELLYLSDVDLAIFRRFEISSISEGRLRAMVYGEKIDTSRHHLKTPVKAATYHLLKIERENGCRVQVILDI
jgi:SHS2 domain-containing protein